MTRRLMLGLLAGTPLSALVPKCLPLPEAETYRTGLIHFPNPITDITIVVDRVWVTTADGMIYVRTIYPGQAPFWQRISEMPFVEIDI